MCGTWACLLCLKWDLATLQQELAFALMALRHRYPDWWAFMRPYLDSLPAQGEALREQSFPDELLALLQDESLVREPLSHAAPAS